MNDVAHKCLEGNDPIYAAFAVDYIKMIKDSNEYQNGTLNNAETDSYEILALNLAKNITTLDFDAFNTALINLEIASENLPANDKLQNLYTVMLMYSTYPSNLQNAYEKIFEIGNSVKSIIDDNAFSEDISFSSVIPMYEMVATALYNDAVKTYTTIKEKHATSVEATDIDKYITRSQILANP
jgi:serine/threonine-protein kinase